jgi:hypothetical protein
MHVGSYLHENFQCDVKHALKVMQMSCEFTFSLKGIKLISRMDGMEAIF